MTRVKICGITNLEDACHAVQCGADMLGFNFYRGSKRFVGPESAAKIVAGLNGLAVEKVGVFVNAEIAEIAEITEQVGLDVIQLHGDETHQYVTDLHRDLPTEIIKAVRVGPDTDIGHLLDFDAHAILLDTPTSDYGGSGETFDWSMVEDIGTFLPCVFIAGGLTPENVGRAIRSIHPYAVDVASGVESSPGKKDAAKVAAFIKAAKEAL